MAGMSIPSEPEGFAIGAVAQLVGVPVETLRTWERRYGLPTPARAQGGRRLYSPSEVEQLRLVAQLAHHGERVRDLARLSPEGLLDRLALHRVGEAELSSLPTRLRVALIHPSLGAALAGSCPSGRTRLEIVARADSVDALDPSLELDAILVHERALAGAGELDTIEARAETVLVLTSYMPRARRSSLAAQGVRVVDEATALDVLRQRVEDAFFADSLAAGARPVRVEPEPPRFTRAQLEQLIERPSQIRCECPVHLASLSLRLREFERYSQQCRDESPADAALHRDLSAGAAEAAAILEALLGRLCAQEGIAP